MEKCVKLFMDHVNSECEKYGILLDLRRSKRVKYDDTITCSGWFDCDAKELVVGKYSSDFLGIFVHEYAHMTQWIDYLDGTFPLWKSAGNSIAKYNEWLDGKPTPNISKHIARARDLELDNERRSVRIIRDWGLDSVIDIDDYIRKANAYLLFYNWMRKYRRWSSTTRSPYNTPAITKLMSKKFNMNYAELPSHIEKAFIDARI